DGQTYGVPYAVETLALFSNSALTDVPEPSTFEELVSAAEDGGAENILSLPIGESGDPYHMQPIYTSAGGYLFGKDAEGNLVPRTWVWARRARWPRPTGSPSSASRAC